MTTNDPNAPAAEAGGFPDALRWQLHALRQDMPPARDLWPDIAPRLAPPRQLPGTPTRTPWLALAASLLLVAGIAGIGQGHLREGDAAQTALVEARRLSTDYHRAIDALPAAARSPTLAPAFDELDRSAAQIRRALARDPDSRLLLEQLRRTYARRLELSQRALVG